jgi:hypothetical protein
MPPIQGGWYEIDCPFVKANADHIVTCRLLEALIGKTPLLAQAKCKRQG